ncbi:MAG: cytochrome C oxidase subunit IV family protein [Proteobacteria bacterium]|nr:cytochrome C oxidase subunit IV family protein [Pseudomonadota bacterium]
MSSLKSLLAVWLGLMLLLALTTASSYLSLGVGNTIINLVIAFMKIGLIVCFFMHLPRADVAVRLTAAATLLFLFFMGFLIFGDLLTRHPRRAPWTAPAESVGGPYWGNP